MNKYRIIVTDHALQAMTEIRDYISFELSNPSAARKHLEAFRTEIRKQLTTMPDKFHPISEEPWGSEGVRKFSVKSYYIYYWIKEESLTVYVTDVLYAGSNQKKRLSGMPME
ncbi:MAG: type II toxin-antitoxin system RelE/ParE family toxin [Chordicoccus sp.]